MTATAPCPGCGDPIRVLLKVNHSTWGNTHVTLNAPIFHFCQEATMDPTPTPAQLDEFFADHGVTFVSDDGKTTLQWVPATHPCDGCGTRTSKRVCNSCWGTTDDPMWCPDCNGVCKQKPTCSPNRQDRRAAEPFWPTGAAEQARQRTQEAAGRDDDESGQTGASRPVFAREGGEERLRRYAEAMAKDWNEQVRTLSEGGELGIALTPVNTLAVADAEQEALRAGYALLADGYNAQVVALSKVGERAEAAEQDAADWRDEAQRHHDDWHALRVEIGEHRRRAKEAEATVERWREVTSRLGFGDGITEPQIEPEAFIAECERRLSEANEWVESQLWRNDCYAKGHPDDEDCHECDPRLRLQAAEAEVGRLTRLLGSHADGHRCTCTVVRAGTPGVEPDEWEQDPWCPTHPDVDQIRPEFERLAATVERVRALAKVQAISCRAMHRADHERNWLDVLALVDLAVVKEAEEGADAPEASDGSDR